jgi:hypothetical protein
VAYAVGARSGDAECRGEWPAWLLEVRAEEGLNAPLRVCAEGDEGRLSLGLVDNRPYSLLLDGPTAPREAQYRESLDGEDLVYSTLAAGDVLTYGEDVLAPARMQTDLTWDRGDFNDGETTIDGKVTPVSLALDGFVAGAGALVGLVSEPSEILLEAGSCLQGTFDSATAVDQEEFAGTLGAAAADCLEPFAAAAAGGAAGEASKKILAALDAALLMGRGAQSVLDASAALNESHSVTLVVAKEAAPPPPGASLLSEIRTDWSGVGPSGDPVDVYVGTEHAADSSTQWVGCEGTPAYADFELQGQTRLTGLLAKRDFTPKRLRVQVEVIVDGRQLQQLAVGNDPVPVDLQLPSDAKRLRLAAIRVEGSCSSASEGYLVWGNGAVS